MGELSLLIAMAETKTSRARVAFALLCGLAVCCSVMYITADASESVLSMAEKAEDKHIGAGFHRHTPTSVESVDVKKAARIITTTPDGRERLMDFLNKVEKQIRTEVAGRKADIAAVRAKMAKNMAYNAAARSKMKKSLLAKMAVNAKAAKDALDKAMRQTQAKFAAAAALENSRNAATMKRAAQTRALMRKNKAEAAKALAHAVLNHQRQLAALDQATNAKIKQTNKHIAANAAQIKENAKKARKDLDKAMNRFDNKMRNIHNQALAARSKLVAQANAQDAKFRAYANNRIKRIVASNAAKFREVRAKMAKDRSRADMAIKHAAASMDAALNANKALQDKRFASSVARLNAAKKEANARVAKFRSGFKVSILQLKGVVETQTKKLNKRVNDLSATITKNKFEQAKANRVVNAELKRMVKLGAARYAEHLKKDKELRRLMDKNKAATARSMGRLVETFNARLGAINRQMAKDRKNSERKLGKATSTLYNVLKKNAEAQAKANKALTMATRRAKMDAAAALRSAENAFGSKLAKMHKTVQRLQAKVNRKMNKLTGIVEKNDVLDIAGRAKLAAVSKYNKNQLKGAVRDAIAKGERRALAVEKKMKGINKKTRDAMHAKITLKISLLSKSLNKQIGDLRTDSKKARKLIRAQVLAAIKSAAAVAKSDLAKKVKWAEGKMAALNKGLAHEKKMSLKGRNALRAQERRNRKHIVRQLGEAIGTQERALLALKTETNTKISKLNKDVSAQAKKMEKDARAVDAQIKSNTNIINGKLNAARKAAVNELSAVSAASAKRYSNSIKAVMKGIEKARKYSQDMFGKVEIQMAKDRAYLDGRFKSEMVNTNNKLTALTALSSANFRKTVKDIKAARAKATKEVADAKKYFKGALVELTAKIKQQENRLVGQRQAVTAMVEADRATQAKINRDTEASLKRIVKIADKRHTESKRARGFLRALFNQNKKIAAKEIADMRKKASAQLAVGRAEAAAHKLKVALSKESADQAAKLAGLKKSLAYTKAATAASLAKAKKEYNSRITTLTNTVVANAGKFEKHLSRVTGAAMNWKKASAADRKVLRNQRNAMFSDLNKGLTRAIQLGEAKAKKAQEEAEANIASTKRSLQSTIAVQTEFMADNVFKLLNGKRQKIADNYLSLKAYAAVAKDKVTDYLAKGGKNRNLSSVGDLLTTVGALSKVKVKATKGLGFGAKKIPSIFSGKKIAVKGSVSKINGLVTEYMKVLSEVRNRFPVGLGNYLMAKLETSMQGTGALEVDKVQDRAGNYVFVNGHAVGLSSKLHDFATLAVHMAHYEKALAQLTGKLAHHMAAGKSIRVAPPQWQGN